MVISAKHGTLMAGSALLTGDDGNQNKLIYLSLFCVLTYYRGWNITEKVKKLIEITKSGLAVNDSIMLREKYPNSDIFLFHIFGLNMEIYRVNLPIQSECG